MLINVALCLPREAESVVIVRGLVRNALTTLGVTESCVDDVLLALSEACTNVVDHAAADDEYEVHLQVDEDRCHISVTNPATGFDAQSLDGQMPDPSSVRGRGVAIIHAVMDHVAFEVQPSSGTIVHLVKSLDAEIGSPLTRLRAAAGDRPRPDET